MNYCPSTLLDHVNIDLTITLKIGIDNSEKNDEILEFLKELKTRIEQTGSQILKSNSFVSYKDPFCGSQREKIYFDCKEDGPKYKYGGNNDE